MVSALLLVALVVRILANPLANVVQKKLSLDGAGSQQVNLHTYALLTALALFLILVRPFPALSTELVIYALLTGLFGAFGNLLLLKALEKGELSVLGPINSYKSVVAMLLGIVVLGEFPQWQKMGGVLLIIAGSYFVIDRKNEALSWKLFQRDDIRYRIWAMVLTAVEALFLKKIIELSDVIMAFSIWAISGFVVAWLTGLIRSKANLRKVTLNYMLRIGSIALSIAAMQLATLFIFNHMQVGYALALFQLSALVSVILGFWYFGEKDLIKKLIGSIIMIAGTLIILLL